MEKVDFLKSHIYNFLKMVTWQAITGLKIIANLIDGNGV